MGPGILNTVLKKSTIINLQLSFFI